MNEQPALDALDLDAWIDGATGITASARIIQKGDLLAKRTRLEEELRITRKIPASERGLDDRDPNQIQLELDDTNRQIYDSMLVVTMRDRTQDYRKSLRERLITELDLDLKGNPDHYQILSTHMIADAIIKVETADGREIPMGPNGFGGDRLLRIEDQCGASATIELYERYKEMTSSAPAVQAPLSHSSSSTRGGATSPSKSGPRARGASPRK
jgi:hypothetical protein